MRRFLPLLFSVCFAGISMGQQALNVNLLGRWGEGHCEAVFRRGGYTFVGNGDYLEVYRDQGGAYQRLDRILLPGVVRDIWVKNDNISVSVACGNDGLYIVYFNYITRKFDSIRGSLDTPGFAGGVTQYGDFVFIADGNNGLVTVYVTDQGIPTVQGHLSVPGYAREVWVANDSTVLLAAGEAGLYSILSKSSHSSLAFMDSMRFKPVYLKEDYPQVSDPAAYHVLAVGSRAYVSAGWGGMRIVDISNPRNLDSLSTWTWGVNISQGIPVGGTPVDVRNTWVEGNQAYISAGETGLFARIDVSNPTNPIDTAYPPLNTAGFTSDVIVQRGVSQDSAFVGDGFNGHLLVNVSGGAPPSQIQAFRMADATFDVAIFEQYGYAATGRTGLRIFNLTIPSPPNNFMNVVGLYDTPGEARGVVKDPLSRVYIADGSRGLAIVNVTNPAGPTLVKEAIALGDTCYDVALTPRYAIMASGHDGLRVVDITGNIYEIDLSPIKTPGMISSRAVKVVNDRAYVADLSGVYIYDTSGLPKTMTLLDSYTTGNLEALGLAVVGDSVFVANGSHGFFLWNTVTDVVDTVDVNGKCLDIAVQEKTIYITDSIVGLRMFDFSDPGVFNESGYYDTRGRGKRLAASGKTICVANGEDGLYVLESEIKPEITINPASLDFGPVPVNRTRPLNLWVYNTGTTLLTGKISVSPAYANEFTFSASQFSLPPGDTLRIVVTFKPVNSYYLGQPYFITAKIESNAPDNPTVSVTLNWQGGVEASDGNPYASDVFTLGLWHLNIITGTPPSAVTRDTSANAIHGNVQGGRILIPSKPGFGNALMCEGQNDYVIVPFNHLLNFRNSAFTVELWFQMITKPQSYYILMKRGVGSFLMQYELALAGANASEKGLIARVQDAQGGVHTLQTGSMDILKTGQWYHAAFSWDQDSLRLYLNGVLKDKKMLRGTLINQVTENMGIGASAYKNAPFNGLIDEVRVSKVARQPWEFHVNRSRLVIAETKIDFSNVVLGYRRRVPIKVTNGGTQALTIQSAQTTSPYVTVTPTISNLQLPSGQSTTVWLTFTPVFVSSLAGDYHLVFQSSDPTFPAYSIPLFGKGVQSLPIGAYRSDPFTLGLWHFNELTGTAVVDSSGQGMNGSWNGTIGTWGKFGGALGFDGQNDICVIKPASGKIVAPKWGGFTVEAWFNIKQVPQQMGSLVRRSGSISQFDLYVDANGYVVGQFYNTAGNLTEVRSASMGPIPTLQWTHAAMSFGEDSVRLFINGDRVDIQPFAGRLAGHEMGTAVDTLSIRIGGNWNGTDLFNGDIDEVHLSGIGRQFWEFNVDKARLAVSSDSMDFGRVLIRQKRTAKLAIKNEGVDTLRISGIASTNAVFTVDNANFNVVPGSRKTIRVSYRPNFAVSDTGSVRFNTNDPFMASKNIILKGMGVSQNLVVPYTSDPFTAGLYHFNAGSGTTLADSSGHALHGTLKGGVAWSPSGRFGGSLRFDGANGKVEVPYNSVLNLYDTDFTVEFWFSMLSKPTTTAVLLKRGTDGTRQVEISLDGTDGVVGKVWDYIGGEHSVRTVSMTALNLNQWYHVAFSCDGDSLRLRLNNRIIDKKSLGGTLRAEGTRPLVLGVDSLQNYPFHGYMDELRISRIARETWEFKVLPKRIAVYPTELHFATVKVGQSRLLNFWVANEGDQDLAVSSITGAGGVFTIPDTPTAFTLTRLQNTMIPVKYSPDASNITHTAILTITSNDTSRTTVIVTLEGSGTDWTGPPPAPAADYHTLALYRFNEASGDTARDASQRTHNGRLMNGVGRTKGYFAKGLYFDGVNDRVEIPYHADFDLDFASKSFTIECYFRTDTSSQALLTMGVEDSVRYGISFTNEGQVEVKGFGSGGPRMNDNAWHHLAFTYNHVTKTGRLYIDGTTVWSKLWNASTADLSNRPLFIGAAERTRGNFFRHFEGYLDELRISDIVREPWEFHLVEYGIAVQTVTPDPPQYGSGVTLDVHIPVELEAQSTLLYYRSGGSRSYSKKTATLSGGTTYRASIPAGDVSLTGLEYYFAVVTSTDTLTYPGIDPVNKPMTKVIRHGVMDGPFTFKHRQFKMFSVPFQLDTVSVLGVLVDDLGPYDPYNWRLFWWHNVDSVYKDYTNTTPLNYFALNPGRAYWVVTDLERTFDIGRGQSVSTDSSFGVTLLKGWNMISSPFYFAIRWDDCFVSSDSVGTLTYYDPENGYRIDWPTFEPWEGYWVYNTDTVAHKIFITPKQSGLAKNSMIRDGVLSEFQDAEWLFKISAEMDEAKDLDNFAGVRRDARDGFDPKDRPEPPPVDDYVSLYFYRSAQGFRSGTYAADIRTAGKEGYIWEFCVESSHPKETVRLSWKSYEKLPDGWSAFLFDLEEGVAKNMMEIRAGSFETGSDEPNVRRFRMVVGSKVFIENHSDGIPLEPVAFALAQNYPNPFNPETTIRYSLPKKADVEIVIFNAIGQQVRVLRRENQMPGHHVLLWDGRDDYSRPVPSGVYICRLKAATMVTTRKMVLMK